MRRNNRRGTRDGDRISKFVRDSMNSDFAREAGGRMKSFVTERPVLSTCLGVGAGLVLGMLIRRGR